METKNKFRVEIEKAKAKNQNTYEKGKTEFDSDGLIKEMKQKANLDTKWYCEKRGHIEFIQYDFNK